ncbi:MAG: dihydropteroate synthase [Phycisphaerales bacterium]|nr:MAG: dihydropteroate synthase [Phycisphaerales bacterium]
MTPNRRMTGPLVLGEKVLHFDRGPRIMGVLNVTPDSFSDGGLYMEPRAAIEHGLRLAADGADIIDVGGESTRPGSEPVTATEQMRRVVPVIEGLRAAGLRVPISIDARLAEVAAAALEAGADAINDVAALRGDPALVGVAREYRAGLVLMHMRGTPATMQDEPEYEDVVGEVAAFLHERVKFALEAGIERECIVVDPGIGFGKTTQHNLLLLRNLDRVAELGCPVLLGVSRKRFLGELLGEDRPERRDFGTAAAVAWGILAGVHIFRVHDVKPIAQVLTVCRAIAEAQ